MEKVSEREKAKIKKEREAEYDRLERATRKPLIIGVSNKNKILEKSPVTTFKKSPASLKRKETVIEEEEEEEDESDEYEHDKIEEDALPEVEEIEEVEKEKTFVPKVLIPRAHVENALSILQECAVMMKNLIPHSCMYPRIESLVFSLQGVVTRSYKSKSKRQKKDPEQTQTQPTQTEEVKKEKD